LGRQNRRSPWILGCMAFLLLGIWGCGLQPVAPVAEFTVSPVVLYAGEAFRLDGSFSAGRAPIVSYTWALGDGQSLAGQQVSATLSRPGTYAVELTVEDANGRSASLQRQIVVYARTGTVLLEETFLDGERALGRWILDPTWASAGDARIDFVAGAPGHALYIRSAPSRWHRRYRTLELPPLRVGQRFVFSCRIMALRTQDFHAFVFSPGRPAVDSLAGALPFYRFTSEGGGSYVHTPSALGTDLSFPVEHLPDVYRWHTYTFVFGHDSYALQVDGVVLREGPLDAPFRDTSQWVLVLGDESLTETCNAYFDDILVTIQE
jgi:PKD repeat protein